MDLQTWNTNGKEGLMSTVELLMKVACFAKKQVMFALSKASPSVRVSCH
jgi:hypothetical protein